MSSSASDVDVVIPTLADNPYLADAVLSVIDADSTDAHLNVIVVVDGVEGDLPLRHERVRTLYTGKRRGSGGATNVGVASGRSQFVARMDADDICAPSRFVEQVAYLRTHPDVVLVGTEGNLVDRSGTALGPYPSAGRGDLRPTLLSRNPLIHSSFLMRREHFAAVGGYDESCIRMQDYELALRLARMGEVHVIEPRLIHYRVHPGQTGAIPSGMVGILRKISHRRVQLARQLGTPLLPQHVRNAVYSAAQIARYAGMKRPGYLSDVGAIS